MKPSEDVISLFKKPNIVGPNIENVIDDFNNVAKLLEFDETNDPKTIDICFAFFATGILCSLDGTSSFNSKHIPDPRVTQKPETAELGN